MKKTQALSENPVDVAVFDRMQEATADAKAAACGDTPRLEDTAEITKRVRRRPSSELQAMAKIDLIMSELDEFGVMLVGNWFAVKFIGTTQPGPAEEAAS